MDAFPRPKYISLMIKILSICSGIQFFNKCRQFGRGFKNKGIVQPVLAQEITSAEAPRASDTRNSGVFRGLDVNIRVADLKTFFFFNTEQCHCFKKRIRSRLFAHAFSVTDGNRDIFRKKVAVQLFDGRIDLVGDDSHFITFLG